MRQWAGRRFDRWYARQSCWNFLEGFYSESDYDVCELASLFGQEDDLVVLGPPPTYRRCPPLKRVPHTYCLSKKSISAIVVVDSDEEDFFGLSRLLYLVAGFVDWSVRLSFVQTSYGLTFCIGTDIIFQSQL